MVFLVKLGHVECLFLFITFLKLWRIRNVCRIFNATDNQIFTYTSRAELFLLNGFFKSHAPQKSSLLRIYGRMKTHLSRIIQLEEKFWNALLIRKMFFFRVFDPVHLFLPTYYDVTIIIDYTDWVIKFIVHKILKFFRVFFLRDHLFWIIGVKLCLYILRRLQNLYQNSSGTYHRWLIMGQCVSAHPSYRRVKIRVVRTSTQARCPSPCLEIMDRKKRPREYSNLRMSAQLWLKKYLDAILNQKL